jgi:hypothetical protein
MIAANSCLLIETNRSYVFLVNRAVGKKNSSRRVCVYT